MLIALSDAREAGIGIGASVVSDAGLLLTTLRIAGLAGVCTGILTTLRVAGLAGVCTGILTTLRVAGLAGVCTGILTTLRIAGLASVCTGVLTAPRVAGPTGVCTGALITLGVAGITSPAGIGAAVLLNSCWGTRLPLLLRCPQPAITGEAHIQVKFIVNTHFALLLFSTGANENLATKPCRSSRAGLGVRNRLPL
jgi:hypothetical protein